MTPITKNVIVVDEKGNKYIPTYEKRAKGLVKAGRARWVDDGTICLACPPDNNYSEDSKMDFDIKTIVERIDAIIAQGSELGKAVEGIATLPVISDDDGNRAEAISRIYASREVTNQKLIELLGKMFDSVIFSPEQARLRSIDKITEALARLDAGSSSESIAEITNSYNEMLGRL